MVCHTLHLPSGLMQAYHPWRVLRGMAGWTLRIAHLPPGMLGRTDHQAMTITLAPGQTQRQRRCTVAHEIGHAERPPFISSCSASEERLVDQLVARRLIPFEKLLDACQWAHNVAELADECWVDEPMMIVRLRHLHPSERLKLRDVFENEAI